MIQLARKIHRIVSYLVFLQVTLWVLGGLAFAALPFDSMVKGGAVTAGPERREFPVGWWQRVAPALAQEVDIHGLAAYDSSQGLLLEVKGAADSRWLRLQDGESARRPDAEAVATYARSLYRGEGALLATRYLQQPQRRYLGLVDELYGRDDVWQVSFKDALSTRLYFDGATGRYLTVRNEAWVFYDAMWRFHIMDYRDGENFNNPLLLVFTVLTLLFTLSGLILTAQAAQRAWQRS